MKRVRAVIAEDEPLARRTLGEHLRGVPWIELVGDAADGGTAVELIDRERPDLVFLDIQMPVMTGLQVVKAIHHRPAIVFTTAFDEHAVSAFELEALDYLLKPFGRKRLSQALERIRGRVSAGGASQDLPQRLDAALAGAPLTRVLARDGDSMVPVIVADIVRVSAADDYSMLHVGARSHLVSVGLGGLAKRLDPERFVRVHRSHLVNLDHVVRVSPHDERRLLVRLSDGSEIVTSRSGAQLLRGLAL